MSQATDNQNFKHQYLYPTVDTLWFRSVDRSNLVVHVRFYMFCGRFNYLFSFLLTGVRHPEEMSFLVKPDNKQTRNNKTRRPSAALKTKTKDKDRDSMASSNSNEAASTGSLDGIPPHTPTRRPSPGYNRGPIGSNASTPNSYGTNGNTPMSVYSSGGSNYSDSFENLNTSLINSPQQPSKEALEGICRPGSYREKARINQG